MTPELWAQRTRSAFLFLPKYINGEWRWLEWARWAERLVSGPVLNGPPVWDALSWADQEAKKLWHTRL